MAAVQLHQRLLLDIAELQTKPYPGISIHFQDEDITKACLVLVVDGYGPMHLTIEFDGGNYPLQPPQIRMDSNIVHPNIFHSYICASILNTTEGYTPAYTLKGIAIQLLSFFGSDKIEQSGGGYSVSLADYRHRQQSRVMDTFACTKCRFSQHTSPSSTRTSLGDYLSATAREYLSLSDSGSDAGGPSSPGRTSQRQSKKSKKIAAPQRDHVETPVLPATGLPDTVSLLPGALQKALLPDEILLMICEQLDFEELTAFMGSWPTIAELVSKYDIIRTRELQCFCFKKNYNEVGLGVGVAVVGKGFIQSEFDLLSIDAFRKHHIQRSVLGIEFEHWLPLPISHGHWNRKVRGELTSSLQGIAKAAGLGNDALVNVIYHFMNDIVVKLNEASDHLSKPRDPYFDSERVKSSLTHASEKAIESYFHLFHLLLCMATSTPGIVAAANRRLQSFREGKTSKSDCNNLGHLLVAALIADVPMDEVLIKAIIREAVTRNVVWMLNKHNPELCYLESSDISAYRLEKTFTASKTSYRLLMFLNLFRRTAVGSPRTKTLGQLCDEAFERHGAPPRGAAKGLANSIKRIHQINNFPEFLVCMGLEKPGPVWFTNFLRRCVRESAERGYHVTPISRQQALALRLLHEPSVEKMEGFDAAWTCPPVGEKSDRSFFPNQRNRGGQGGGRGGGGRGGRGGRGGANGGWRSGR